MWWLSEPQHPAPSATHDLAAKPGQQPGSSAALISGFIHPLRASPSAAPHASSFPPPPDGRAARHLDRDPEHSPAPERAWRAGAVPASPHPNEPANRTHYRGTREREPEHRRPRNDPAQHTADQPFGQRTPIGTLDINAGVVDQVHVIHARRTGRHAGQAGQAPIDMQNDLLGRRPVWSPACP